MGRKLLEIRQFSKGMYGNADGADIDPNVASFCKNADPEAPHGVIQGVRDSVNIVNTTKKIQNGRVMKVSDGTLKYIGFTEDANEFNVLNDYDGTMTEESYSVANNEGLEGFSVETLNNRAYLGFGSASTTPPASYVKHVDGQQRFGSSVAAGYFFDTVGVRAPRTIKISFDWDDVAETMTLYWREDGLDDLLDLPSKGILHWGSVPLHYERVSSTVLNLVGTSWTDPINPPGFLSCVFSEVFVGRKVNDVPSNFLDYDLSNILEKQNVNGITEQDTFDENTSYVLGFSFVYDRFKESPLQTARLRKEPYQFTYLVADGYYDTVQTDIYIQSILNADKKISSRVTSLRIYVGEVKKSYFYNENDELVPHYEPLGTTKKNAWFDYQTDPYRLVDEIDIETLPATQDTLTITTTDVGYGFRIKIESAVGSTYEDNSGLTQFTEDTVLHYKHSVSINNQLFVGNVYNPQAPDEDWKNNIVRSRPLDFEVFDWAEDYLSIPQPVEAMIDFGGRLFVFDRTTMYRVNPQGMYIEDRFTGVIPANKNCLITTEYGLFILTKDQLHLFDGRGFTNVSLAIEEVFENTFYGLRNSIDARGTNPPEDDLWLSYDSSMKAMIIGTHDSVGTNTVMWLYRIEQQSWWVVEVDEIEYPSSDQDGRLIASAKDGSKLCRLFRGARLPWEWWSQPLDMGQSSQQKKFREITAESDEALTITHSIDGGAFGSALDSAVPSSNGNQIQIKVIGTSTATMRALHLLYRDRGGYPG